MLHLFQKLHGSLKSWTTRKQEPKKYHPTGFGGGRGTKKTNQSPSPPPGDIPEFGGGMVLNHLWMHSWGVEEEGGEEGEVI